MVTAYEDCYEDLVGRRRLRATLRGRERAKSAVARMVGRRVGAGAQRLGGLTYHRVPPVRAAQDYALPPMAMPRDEFDAQMAHLARHYAPLPLAEAAERPPRRRPPPLAAGVAGV